MTVEETNKIALLVVDDEESLLESLARRLGLRDFDVTTASDGPQAIEAAKTGAFDLALLDLKMPGMDGQEVLRILKQSHKFLEIVVLTGYPTVDTAVECTKLGAFDYLTKPCDMEVLLDALRRAYEARLKKKFEHDRQRLDEIKLMSVGGSALGILRELSRLDDEEK
jgi:two-component system NtrC family response regulator